jgi:hypothetical protein
MISLEPATYQRGTNSAVCLAVRGIARGLHSTLALEHGASAHVVASSLGQEHAVLYDRVLPAGLKQRCA